MSPNYTAFSRLKEYFKTSYSVKNKTSLKNIQLSLFYRRACVQKSQGDPEKSCPKTKNQEYL